MTKFIEFIRKERLYILLLIFVILMSAIVGLYGSRADRIRAKAQAISSAPQGPVEPGSKEERTEKILEGNKGLARSFTIASLIILLFLFLGLAMDAVLISLKLARKRIDIATYRLQAVRWNAWDVCRVAILFSFFGYMLVIIESVLARTCPLIKNDNFRMIVNSSILDTLTVVFIVYFTVRQYNEKLIALGISFKNFFRNIFYGVAGYITAAPALLAILFGISAVSSLFNYVPQEQHVVRLFMKEENAAFLVYSTVFASIVGPIIEEVFFRGFMYNAFKKYIGIFWAAIITAGIFATLHAHGVSFLPVMALGLLLVYLYEKTGTLVASMTVHVMHNLCMVSLVLLIKQIK